MKNFRRKVRKLKKIWVNFDENLDKEKNFKDIARELIYFVS